MGGFLFEGEGVGAGGRWHAPEVVLAFAYVNGCALAHWGCVATKMGDYCVGGFLPGSDNGGALWQLPKQGLDVGWGSDFEELVRGVFLQPHDLARGVVERYSSPGAELHDSLLVEALFALQLKMVPVAKEQQAHHAPHVVNKNIAKV